MKKLLTSIILFLSLSVFSAEYNGRNIDGYTYSCTAYSYSTGNYYYTSVEFDGDQAIMTFYNGGYIYITLDDEEIDDPSNINGYSYRDGVYWILDVDL